LLKRPFEIERFFNLQFDKKIWVCLLVFIVIRLWLKSFLLFWQNFLEDKTHEYWKGAKKEIRFNNYAMLTKCKTKEMFSVKIISPFSKNQFVFVVKKWKLLFDLFPICCASCEV